MYPRVIVSCFLAVAIPAAVAFGAPATPAAKPAPPKEDYYDLYKILADTVDQVDRNYVKEIDRRELIEAAIKGMMTRLDPYSTYIGPEELSQFRSTVESEFGGVGIHVTSDDGEMRVLSPIYGTPAYRAGIMAGDQILEIDGKSTEGFQSDDAIERMKGKEGTPVKLTIVHPHSTKHEVVTLMRERIHVETVLGDRRKADDTWDYMFDPRARLGYIRVTAFSRDTANELQRALQELTKEKVRGVILDLRFNPGGLLNSAIEVSNLFISHGRIVSTKGRNSPERVWDAHPEGAFEGFPLVILVNHYSASASEIVSACLQDHKRAVVMGERTWGKGSVQNIIELDNGRSALKLTTAAYRRPSGKNIHRFPDSKPTDEWGVMPSKDYEMTLGDRETLALMTDRRNKDILKPHEKPATDHAAEADAVDRRSDESVVNSAAILKTSASVLAAKSSSTEASTVATVASESHPQHRRSAIEAESAKAVALGVKSEANKAKPFVDRQLEMALKYLNDELAHPKPQ